LIRRVNAQLLGRLPISLDPSLCGSP
jgi:hypothetical protein